MADTVLSTDLRVQKWLKNYFVEYVRTSGFKPYMGTGTNSVIQVKRELQDHGKTINIPLITRLKGAGVTGTNTLAGNEEALGNFNHPISIEFLRNAVVINEADQHWTILDLMGAAKDALNNWAADKLRADLITALGSIDGVAYGTASAAQRNTWTVNNQDRILFGRSASNYNATHATALNAITGTDRLNAATLSLMKRRAKTADPFIRPTRVNTTEGREYFVAFTGSMAFRDLKNDPVMQQANREARPRDVEANPIFQDGDLIYDGVIVREIPEIGGFNNTAATPVRLEPVYMCGAQALGVAWGKETTPIRDNFDYGMRQGVGVKEVRGISKLRFNTGNAGASKDHGVFTGFMAAPLDA